MNTSEGSSAVAICPHRVVACGEAFVAAAPAVRALKVLNDRARLRDVDHWREDALELIRGMGLPRSWW